MSRRRQVSKSRRGAPRSRRSSLGDIVHQLDRSTTHAPETRKRIGRTSLNAPERKQPRTYVVTLELIEKSYNERMVVLQAMAEAAVNVATSE